MSLANSGMPLVSVLMSCYREPIEQLKIAVGSILSQSYANIELLLVLDDPSNSSAGEYLEAVAGEDDRIRLIHNEKNLGLVGSLNKALGLAGGEYVCRMDADDISEPDRIERQLEYLTSEGLDLVGSYMTVIDDGGDEMYKVSSIPTKPKTISRALKYNNCVPHPTWFGRRQVFEAGYRQIPLCEDYDFLLRAVLEGYSLGNCPAFLVRYRMSANSLSRSNLYRQYLYQRELTGAYRRGLPCDPKHAESQVEARYAEATANKYAQANSHFNQGLEALSSRHPVKGAGLILSAWIVSPAYFCKSVRLVGAAVAAYV